MNTPVRILGIDPGFDRLGVCILEKKGTVETLLFSTCINTQRTDTFGDRLLALGNELSSIVQTYAPNELALEKLFFTKNQTTAINVAEVRGVVLYLCAQSGIPTFEYSPPQIKLAVTGYGKATKLDISRMVPKILRGVPDKLLDDELDAIAIALTHSAHRNMSMWK